VPPTDRPEKRTHATDAALLHAARRTNAIVLITMRNILHTLGIALGLTYDPAHHARPAPKRPCVQVKKPTPAPNVDGQRVHDIEGHRYVEQTPPPGINTEWRQENMGDVKQRSAVVTDADLAQLGGLDPKKAGAIKSLWARGLTIAECSRTLTTQHGRGWSERTISDYVAAFARANHEAP